MKRELKHYLMNFGLSEMQAEIYLSVLKTGPMKVADIVKSTGYKRISCYTALEKLKSLLLIKEEPKKYGRKITAAPPTSLKTLLGEQKRKLRKLELGFEKLLPEFESFRKLKLENHDTSLSFFEGKEAVKRVWMGPLLENETLLRVFTDKSIAENFPELYTDFLPARLEKQVFTRLIGPADEIIVRDQKRDPEFLREIRILKERVALSSDIEIGEQKILITSWKEPIFAVMIKNQFVIQNFTAIFDALWKSIE